MAWRRWYWRAAALTCLALLAGGWTSPPAPVVQTHSQVIAIALDGGRLAWADCQHLFVQHGQRRVSLTLSFVITDQCQEAQLVLEGQSVGWLFADVTGNSEAITVGGVSLQPRLRRRFWSENYAIDPVWEGIGYGGLASDGHSLLWSHPRISLLGPVSSDCDLGVQQPPPCSEQVAGGTIHTWLDGTAGTLPSLPPAAALAASHGWVAALVLPVGTTAQTQVQHPRTIQVLREADGSVLASVPSHGAVDGLALSHRLLAVEQGSWVRLYRLPGGRLLRRVPAPLRGSAYRNSGWIAVAGDTLVVWSPTQVRTVAAATGRSTTLVQLPANGSRGTVTAVATDDTRIAWVTTNYLPTRSAISIRRVG